jgi:hypothetical protein
MYRQREPLGSSITEGECRLSGGAFTPVNGDI